MKNTFQRYDIRTFLVHVDSYEHGVPVGRYYNLYREETDTFLSMSQLILKLEQSLNVDDVPQAFNKVRSFYPSVGYSMNTYRMAEASKAWGRRGKLGSFVIQISFRRNASWQGTVVWIEEDLTQNFRSVLELMVLLDSALGQKETSEWMLDENMKII